MTPTLIVKRSIELNIALSQLGRRVVAVNLEGYERGMVDDGIHLSGVTPDGLALTSAEAREIAVALHAAADKWESLK